MNNALSCALALFVTALYSANTAASHLPKTIVFLDNSVANDTYIPSNKERQIAKAFELAKIELVKKYPNCDLKTKSMVERSSLTNLLTQVKDVTNSFDAKSTIIVGLIHSSEALLAAKAFSKSEFVLLSSGATTEELKSVNPRFYSTANTVEGFTSKIADSVYDDHIKNLVILTPGSSSYASEFARSLKLKLSKQSTSVSTVVIDPAAVEISVKRHLTEIMKADALFIPGFVQQSLPIVSVVQANGYTRRVIGTPNWGRSVVDLNSLTIRLKLKREFMSYPVSWVGGETAKSVAFEKRFKVFAGEDPMGTAVYTFDAAVIAGEYLCTEKEVTAAKFEKFVRKIGAKNEFTVRTYNDVKANHFDSPINMTYLRPLEMIAHGD